MNKMKFILESVNTGSTKPTTRAAVHQQNRQQYHSDMSLRTNTAEKTKVSARWIISVANINFQATTIGY